MKTKIDLVRSPEDRALPRDILATQARTSHRPPAKYRLILRSAKDAEEARRVGLPVFAITDSMVTMLGYSMTFPPLVLVPRGMKQVVETKLPVIEFLSEAAIRQPRLDDIIVAMLRFDPLAARALAQRNDDAIDKSYLLKRILQEDLEEEATRVRFQDLLPALPLRGEPLQKRALDRIVSSNVVRGGL